MTDTAEWPPGEGEMAQRVRAFDWASTPLGPRKSWSPELKTAAAFVLENRFPAALVWGSGLVTIYNDAFRPILGEKPEALGRSFAEIWSEVWNEIGPIAERAFAGESTFIEDFELRVQRHGRPESAWFTFSYSPVRNSDGAVVGMIDTVIETTDSVRTRHALAEEEQRFRALVTAGAYSIYRMSPDWRLMYLLGSDRMATTSEPIEDWADKYIVEEDRPRVDAAIGEAIRTKSLFELEHRVHLSDGRVGWVLSRAVPLLGPHGEIVEWFGAASDMTARKQGELALRDSEGQLEAELSAMKLLHDLTTRTDESGPEEVLERGLDATMALLGADFGNVQVYDAAHGKLRIAAQRGFDQSFLDHFAEVDARAASACGLALAGRKRAIVEDTETDPAYAPNRDAARAAGYRSVQSTPLFTAAGEPLGMISTHFREPRLFSETELRLTDLFARELARSIERARGEAALRESEGRFRQFGQASSDLLWIRDAESLALEYLSPAFERLYGVPREQVLEANSFKEWARLLHPDDREAVLGHLREVRGGDAKTYEFRVVRPNGDVYWIRNTDFPLFDDEGKVQRIAGIAHDMNQRKHAQELQAMLLAELQHRVRNILAMIQSVARRTLETSESLEEYARHLSGRISAMARTQALLTRTPDGGVNLEEILRDELLSVAADERQYWCEGPDVKLQPKAAEVFALAIHELSTNAVKYGAFSRPEGQIEIRWSLESRDGQQWLTFVWEESRVGDVAVSGREGFGTELITKRVPYELRGRGTMERSGDGITATVEFPLVPGNSILETSMRERER